MYALLLFILFPILYNKNRTWYFIYALLFFVVGRFIAYKLGLSYAAIIHNVFYIGVLIPFLIGKAYRKYYLPISLWVVVYVFYLYFLHISHGNEFVSDLKANFRILFVFIFAVEVFENIQLRMINMDYFVKYFKVVLLFEITLCWLQFISHDFGNFFRITEYTWNGEVMSISGSSYEKLGSNLCLGTLMGASTFANYLSFSIVTLFLAKSKSGFCRNDYYFLVLSVLTLLITGIRAPFLVLLLMLFFVLMKGKNISFKIIYLIVGITFALFLLPILSALGSQGGLNSLDNTVLRSLNVFTQVETGTVSEEGTLTWPLSMIPYIMEHPFFGNGLHYGTGYFMALNFHTLEDLSLSDAGFFYHWAEYGLVGLLIFFFFYFYIIKICPRYKFKRSDIRFLVITLFLQSIVDCCIVDHYCYTVFALSPICIYYYQNIIAVKR